MIAYAESPSSTFNALMDCSLLFDTINYKWSIVYVEGSQVIIYKQNCISFSEDSFCLSK